MCPLKRRHKWSWQSLPCVSDLWPIPSPSVFWRFQSGTNLLEMGCITHDPRTNWWSLCSRLQSIKPRIPGVLLQSRQCPVYQEYEHWSQLVLTQQCSISIRTDTKHRSQLLASHQINHEDERPILAPIYVFVWLGKPTSLMPTVFVAVQLHLSMKQMHCLRK